MEMINWKIIIPAFLVLLFFIRYYDLFYLYQPVQSFSLRGYTPSLGSFVIYNYSLKVLFYLLKFPLVAAILMAGIFLEGNKNKEKMASFGELLIMVVVAEFIFLTSDLYKIIHFAFMNTTYSELEYQNFYPFSVFSIFQADSNMGFAYLFQALNIFEVSYIICLIIGLRKLQFPTGSKAVAVTLYSYGSMLVFWILIMTYFKL